MTPTEWRRIEGYRQAEKDVSQARGHLMQNLLGLLPGCVSTPAKKAGGSATTLPDIVCCKRQIIAEIKSADNTLNSASGKGTYGQLVEFLNMPKYRGYTAVVVQLASKSR